MAQQQNIPGVNELIRAVINAANSAQAANAAAAAAIVPPAPVAAPFALLPGDARQAPLDYNRSEDMKIFNKAISGMEDKFDLKEDKLHTFLDAVKEKARIFNWANVIQIPDAQQTDRNLLTNFGQLTAEDCRAYATAHVGQTTRRAQNDMILFQFLSNSLTVDARLNMKATESSYHVNNVPSGLMYLKAIVGRASVDTYAKVMLLRQEIANSKYKMIELKGDVRAFNLYVSHKRAELLGRGHYPEELMTHLFNAYLRVPNEDFLFFIKGKKNQYESDGVLTADKLMSLALSKYDLVMQQEALASEDDGRIVALMASQKMVSKETEPQTIDIETLQAMIAKLNGNSDTAAKYAPGNKRRPANNKKNNALANAWKKVKPSEGESMTKTVNGRKYNWCKFHQAWTVHTQAECTLGKESTGNNASQKEEKKNEGSLALNKVLLAMMSEDSSA